MSSSVPNFYLYGEPQRTVDERFVHVEALADRTRPSEWTIRPHAHPELNHIFHVVEGGGAMRADSVTLVVSAPCLLLVPAGTIHAFQWTMESSGSVVTLANSYLDALIGRDPDLAALFAKPAALQCDAGASIPGRINALAQELGWRAPGHRAAADAGLLDLLVWVLRLKEPQGRQERRPDRAALLVARLRQMIEERFRLREPVEAYAGALGVSPRRLRAVCASIARQSPAEMLDHRAILEAKRSLLYGQLAVVQIAYALGFADPAYFNRFFSRHVGISPARFRRGPSPY